MRFLPAALVLLGLAGAATQAAGVPELVLAEHTRLTAHTKKGAVTVIAGRGVERAYEWDGCRLEPRMKTRSERWLGNFGILDGAPAFRSLFGQGCKGIRRSVVQEGQYHLADQAAAQQWLARFVRYRNAVWTQDGLLVVFELRPSRAQLNVDVFQLCIDGRRPAALPGASDAAIAVIRDGVAGEARLPCAQVPPAVVQETRDAWTREWAPRKPPP